MNIKIQNIDGRWVVVVNSIGGKFQEDVTDTIDMYIRDKAYAEAKRISDETKDRELVSMRQAIDGCIEALESYVYPVG